MMPLASDKPKPFTSSALIAKLRQELIHLESGGALGSEAELLARLRVSRSSLRQAARVLEREQLLEVRRGIRGGYYARRPEVSAVAQAAANYLHLREARWSDLLTAGRVLTAEICRAAAANPDPAKRARLARAAQRMHDQKGDSVREFVRADVALQAALTGLADNSFLELYQSIGWGFGVNQKQVSLWRTDERRERWRRERVELCQAVLRSEPEVAVALANRGYQLISQWIEEAGHDGALDLRALGGMAGS